MPSELRLGKIYLDGDLVPPDFAQAKTCLEMSAYQGNQRAATLLDQMYRAGIGMKADPTEACAWSEVATLEGKRLRSARTRRVVPRFEYGRSKRRNHSRTANLLKP
jgi:TPR repeat protein